MTDPFDTLGMPPTFALDREHLEQRYRELQRALHPDRFTQAPASERRMALSKAVEVNQAYRVLRDDVTRAEALLSRRDEATTPAPADPDLLMTIMELRESLSDAKAARDMVKVRALSDRVNEATRRTEQRLRDAFDASTTHTDTLRGLVHELKYYRRFLDEVAVIEDETVA